jgi:hypothetical protein
MSETAGALSLPEKVQFMIACRIVTLCFAIRFGRNHRGFARLRQRLENPLVSIVAFIRNDDGCVEGGQQRVGSFQVAGLSGCQQKASRVAQGIDRGINLGAQPAFAAANGLTFTLFF